MYRKRRVIAVEFASGTVLTNGTVLAHGVSMSGETRNDRTNHGDKMAVLTLKIISWQQGEIPA